LDDGSQKDPSGLVPDVFADQLRHLARFGVAVGLQLGIQQLPVDADLEAAPIGGDDRQRFDLRLESFEQFYRQTGGAPGVVSNGAVFQLDLQQHVRFSQNPPVCLAEENSETIQKFSTFSSIT
jgi:hypothetical protein